jgi:hypothetical protein
MDMPVGEEWGLHKRRWVALIVATLLMPFSMNIFPILAASIVDSSSRIVFVGIVAANVILNLAPLVPLFSAAKRLRVIGEMELPGWPRKGDPGIYQVASIVIGAWDVIMTALGVVGMIFID